jgi:putative endonuclease
MAGTPRGRTPRDPRRRLGDAGERLAVGYLEQRGYRVIDRNVRRREGEVDLVAVEGAGSAAMLVFVEVKLRRSRPTGRAIEALGVRKQRRLRALAEAYSMDHPDLPEALRIDLVAIDLDRRGAIASVEHVRSAVEG